MFLTGMKCGKRIIGSKNDEVLLTILRDGKMLQRRIALEENIAMGDQKMIGISQYAGEKSCNILIRYRQ